MSGTSLSERISWAEDNLKRQLDWISRHDSRIAVIFGICVAMLGFLATETTAFSKLNAGSIFFSMGAIAAQTVSLAAIYFSHYPRTVSPSNSLLFFGDIAKLGLQQFSTNFCSRTEKEHLNDLCDQIHINATIITKKFDALKVALIFLLLSAPPWVAEGQARIEAVIFKSAQFPVGRNIAVLGDAAKVMLPKRSQNKSASTIEPVTLSDDFLDFPVEEKIAGLRLIEGSVKTYRVAGAAYDAPELKFPDGSEDF